MTDNLDKQLVDWHSGFYAATCYELRNDAYALIREYELNKQPIRIDIFARACGEGNAKNELAHIFRKYNIVEYKNPNDTLGYVEYFKVLSYACLYIGNSAAKDKVLPEEVTVSLFRANYPEKLIKQLRLWGYEIYKYADGIYYVQGNTIFPTQIVVTDELDAKEHIVLRALTNRLDQKQAELFIELAKALENDEAKQNIDAVLQVSVNVNRELYDEIKRRKIEMCEALRELMKDDIEEIVKKAVADKEAKIANQAAELENKDAEIADKDAELAAKDEKLAANEKELANQAIEIARLKAQLAAKE